MINGFKSVLSYLYDTACEAIWGDTNYTLDLTRIGFIWFSPNPDEFMPLINQKRLIENRKCNPEMQFYLLYSSISLNNTAHEELISFSKIVGLILIDFDTDLKSADKTILDNDIYDIAALELQHARTKSGGNLAAGSDSSRLLETFLALCANYIDIDEAFDFSNMPKYLSVKEPVIVPSRIVDYGSFKAPAMGNHFIGCSVLSKDPTQLHPAALTKLRDVKVRITENYDNLNAQRLLSDFSGLPSLRALDPLARSYVSSYFNGKNVDIFSYRLSLMQKLKVFKKKNADKGEDPINDSNYILFHNLYKDSVVKISGPDTWYYIFKDIVVPLQISVDLQNLYIDPFFFQILMKEMENANDLNNGLKEKFAIGQKSDLSWTPYYRKKMKARCVEIDKLEITHSLNELSLNKLSI